MLPPLFSACAFKDSHPADVARTRLMGMSEEDLESCIGAPDQHSSFGNTHVLTYDATTPSSINWSFPLVGGLGFSNGGCCHATFTVVNGCVQRVLYSGEKNATGAPDACCAPIIRTCIAQLGSAGANKTPATTAPAARTNNRLSESEPD
jgi:hypothetical protein